MMTTILLDTSFVVALNNPKDKNHVVSVQFFSGKSNIYLLPEVVLTEAAFLLGKAGGLPASLQFLDRLVVASVVLQSITLFDLKRAREIMGAYPAARLDFVDCCLMALSERLQVTQICTYDRRDFSMFRPQHCDYLELLPHRE
jgi:predicted nucleic acid-binding protein